MALIAKPKSSPSQVFRSTSFNTAVDKAKFFNRLTCFVSLEFPRAMYFARNNNTLYYHLHQHMGHIAHYNRGGFWSAQFEDTEKQIAFLKFHIEQSRHANMAHADFTWSDVQQKFGIWITQTDVIRVLQERRGLSAPTITSKEFKIAALSSNTGSFGHTQAVVIARDGEAWKLQHIQSNGKWENDQVLTTSIVNGTPTWEGLSVECPERLSPNAPESVIRQVWG